jgi:pimeloyl-ACP methyl ester carboxylesterase
MIAALLLSALALAAPSGYCHTEAARQISVPLYPDDSSRSERISYTYAIGGQADSDRPWIIVLPGGPGQASISMPLAMPSNFPIIRIDPRGVGCNSEPMVPADALASNLAAADVVAVIRREKLQNYIIYGASYGTLLATLVAEKLEADGGPRPRAVVLEGIIGRAFGPNEYLRAQMQRWEQVKKQLSADTRAELSSKKMPFDLPSTHIASWVASLLYAGVPAGGQDDLAVDELEKLRNEKQRPFLKKRIDAITAKPDSDRLRVFRENTCREIAPDMRDLQFDFELVKGRLIPRDTKFCDGIEPTALFDSARVQLESPIYYFSGLLDPATPPDQARYHFAHQARSARTLVTVPRGAHLALTLNLMDCSERIWNAIADRKGLPDALASCGADPKPSIEYAGPRS